RSLGPAARDAGAAPGLFSPLYGGVGDAVDYRRGVVDVSQVFARTASRSRAARLAQLLDAECRSAVAGGWGTGDGLAAGHGPGVAAGAFGGAATGWRLGVYCQYLA